MTIRRRGPADGHRARDGVGGRVDHADGVIEAVGHVQPPPVAAQGHRLRVRTDRDPRGHVLPGEAEVIGRPRDLAVERPARDVARAIELLKPIAALEALREGREEEARRMIASVSHST